MLGYLLLDRILLALMILLAQMLGCFDTLLLVCLDVSHFDACLDCFCLRLGSLDNQMFGHLMLALKVLFTLMLLNSMTLTTQCLLTLIICHVNAWMLGCLDAWMLGCLDAWILG